MLSQKDTDNAPADFAIASVAIQTGSSRRNAVASTEDQRTRCETASDEEQRQPSADWAAGKDTAVSSEMPGLRYFGQTMGVDANPEGGVGAPPVPATDAESPAEWVVSFAHSSSKNS